MPANLNPNAVFVLLQNESHLIRGSLWTGMTCLRRSTMGVEESIMYPGFFLLATAVERILKLILIIDNIGQNGLSASQSMRRYNHGISRLLEECEKVAHRISFSDFKLPEASSPEGKVLAFFESFANGARYFNIDALCGETPKFASPIDEWDGILATLLVTNGQRLSSTPPDDPFILPTFRAQASSFAVVALHEVIRPPIKLLLEIGDITRNRFRDVTVVPFLEEFFNTFWGPRRELLTKRRWP